MLNVKLLVGSLVGTAGVLKLWTEPVRWGIVFDVVGALLLSWIIFIAVLYLTAARLRRDPAERPRRKRPQADMHPPASYTHRFTQIR